MSEDTTTSEQLAEIEGQAQPIQVREGRWRTRNGEVKDVKSTPTEHTLADKYPWWDRRNTWRNDGRFDSCDEHPLDLLEHLGPIEPQPADTVDELRSEIHYLQKELGESRQRVARLEELVTSLQRQLAVAKEQLTIAAAVSQQLQIELDAAQQVPADSPELQQLRLRLADMTLDRDQYKDAYDSTFDDLLTTRETTKAEAVEAIIEWLQHFRGCNSPSLALLLLEALPHIMRSLTGLDSHAID